MEWCFLIAFAVIAIIGHILWDVLSSGRFYRDWVWGGREKFWSYDPNLYPSEITREPFGCPSAQRLRDAKLLPQRDCRDAVCMYDAGYITPQELNALRRVNYRGPPHVGQKMRRNCGDKSSCAAIGRIRMAEL